MTTTLTLPESKSLYHIADDLTTFFNSLETVEAQLAEPQETPDERAALEQSRTEIRARLDEIGGELATKTDAVAGVLRRLGSERDFIEEEEHRLRERRKSCERAEKWLRDYVISVMRQNGMKQLKSTSNTLSLRGSDAVLITDAAKVPATYQNAEVKLPLWLWERIKATAQPMLTEVELHAVYGTIRVKAEPSLSTIKRAIKAGEVVDGADLEIRDSLVLR